MTLAALPQVWYNHCESKEGGVAMSKVKKILPIIAIILAVCGCLCMLYVHRRIIIAAIKGEKLPESPDGGRCPVWKKQ